MSEFQLSPENRLNMTNYEEWFFQIGNFLTAKNVFDYVEQNVIHKLETQMAAIPAEEVDAVEQFTNQLRIAIINDALAKTIICNNVTNEAIKYIKGLRTAFEIIEKLKAIYKGNKSADIHLLIEKFYTLKAKDISNCKDDLNQTNEIFKKLEKNNTNLSSLEKLRIIYLSFPNELKYHLRPKGNENVDNFIQQAYDVNNFQMYLKHNTKYKNSNIK